MGVGARTSAAWSHKVVSVSCPTAEITGIAEPGENPHVTAAREVKEETGVDAEAVAIIGTITLLIGLAAAVTAYFTQETYRIHMNDLGDRNAVPVPLEEYHRIRTSGMDESVR